MEIDVITIIAIVGIMLQLFNAIARLTPTTKDDALAEKLRKMLEFVANLGIPNRVVVGKKVVNR